MFIPNPPEPWYALRVKPRHERACAAHLAGRGIEEFTPTFAARRRWSDRIKELERPLFPGYVFCRFHSGEKLAVLTTPWVQSIVSFGKMPARISDEEIAAVRAITASGLPYGPWPYVRVGDRVRIETGCLEGVLGTLVRMRDEMRVVVNVELLQRSVAVEIDREFVSLVPGTPQPLRPVASERAAPMRITA